MGKLVFSASASTAAITFAIAAIPAAAYAAPAATTPAPVQIADAAAPDSAQTPDKAPEPGAQEIVVTGFRSSLKKAIDLKRDAIGVRDSIVAEDIGKFPEQNVAESLQRIPGVFLLRDGPSNEGQRISIRGLGPDFSVTTINGAPVRTTSASNVGQATRSFDFDVFPSELFGRVDIYKTPLANLEEGGIGGNVDLQTPRPFDNNGRVIRYTAAGQYNTSAKAFNPRVSALFSDTWGNFGLLVGIAYARNDNLRSGFQSTGGYNTDAIAAQGLGGFNYALNLNSPQANLGSLTVAQVENAYLPRFFRAESSYNRRERLGATASLQYKTSNLDLSIDGIYSRLKDSRDDFTFGVPVRNTSTTNPAAAPGQYGNTGLIPLDVSIDANNNLYGTFGNAQFLGESFFYDSTTNFKYVIARGVWNIDNHLKLSGQGNYTNSAAVLSANRIVADIYGATVTYDPTGNAVYPSITSPVSYTNVSSFAASGNNDPSLSFSLDRETDEERTGRLVLDYTPDPFGALSLHAKLGGNYVDTIKEVRVAFGNSLASTSPLPNANNQTFRQLNIYSYMDPYIQTGAIPNGGDAGFPSNWATFPRSFVMNTLSANAFNNNPAAYQPSSSFNAEERVASAFFELEGKILIAGHELRFNSGVRYSNTKTSIDNSSLVSGAYVPNHRDGGYSNVLPSGSAAFDLTPKLVVRASAGQTVTRASLSYIAAATNIPNIFDATAVSGNPNLKPQFATQFDAGIEWYFQPGGLLSFGWFKKDISDTTLPTSTTVPFSSLGLPNNALASNYQINGVVPPNTPVQLLTYYNSGSYTLNGLEFAYTQNFRFLPKPFDGLGFTGSYTKVNTTGFNFVTSSGQSYKLNNVPDHSFSLTGFYERGPFALRMSYNYRSAASVFQTGGTVFGVPNNFNNGNNLEDLNGGVGYLDMNVSYKIFDGLEVRVDVLNLTNTLVYDYFTDPSGNNGNGHSRLDNAVYDGRTISFGIRGKF